MQLSYLVICGFGIISSNGSDLAHGINANNSLEG